MLKPTLLALLAASTLAAQNPPTPQPQPNPPSGLTPPTISTSVPARWNVSDKRVTSKGQQPPSRCQRSGRKFLGHFLAGAGTGILSGVAFTAIADVREYSDYSRPGGGADGGSATFVRHVMLAGTAGSTAGVWFVARRNCGHLLPALIGASLPTLLAWSSADENPGPLAVGGVIVLLTPLQALSATLVQTIVR